MRARSERGRLPGSGDLSQHIDQPLISFTVLFREARHDVAKVVFVEAGALIDRAGQEALAKRTEGYEADTQLFQQRQDFFFGLPPPQRIFALQRRHGLHRMCAADRLRARFRHAEMLDLAFPNQFFDGSSHVLHRNVGIDAMLVEKIDAVCALTLATQS
jgi:hypothetical protein